MNTGGGKTTTTNDNSKMMLGGPHSPHYFNESISMEKTEGKLQRSKFLPSSFVPCSWTVVCGRGKECYDQIGNKRLKVLVDANLERYKEATTKMQKSLIVTSLVEAVHEAASVVGFIKKDPESGRWMAVTEETAREKVGQLLREAMTKQDPAKVKARKERRRARAEEARESTERMNKRRRAQQFEMPSFQQQIPQQRLRNTEWSGQGESSTIFGGDASLEPIGLGRQTSETVDEMTCFSRHTFFEDATQGMGDFGSDDHQHHHPHQQQRHHHHQTSYGSPRKGADHKTRGKNRGL